MRQEKLTDILIAKAQNNKLAHLYTVSPYKKTDEKICLKWCNDFLSKVANDSHMGLENHQDILILQAQNKDKFYNADQITEIQNFLKNKAQQLARKYIVIAESEKVNTVQYNKLLKSLEEPPIEITIFLINENNQSLLETIKSRSIELKINSNEFGSEGSLIGKELENLSFSEFQKYIQTNNITIEKLLGHVLTIYSQKSDAMGLNSSLSIIKGIEQDQIFGNSAQYSQLKIYQLLQQVQ